MKTILGMLRQRWRWIVAPGLAFVALAAWAFASPVGAAPDDDYHLVSIWCANGGSDYCEPGSTADRRDVAVGFASVSCYAQKPEASALCQEGSWSASGASYETRRGNFYGEYPPLYYGTMRLFAGDDVRASAIVMRLVNAAIFVALTTTLAALLPVTRRRTLLWGWLITTVPLGMFLIASNNPSGWAITGVGTAFLALLGWFETTGRRHWALGCIYLVAVLMAAGARGDAAVYVAGATGVVAILTAARTREWSLHAILPAVGLLVAVALLSTAGQAGVATSGFTNGNELGAGGDGASGAEVALGGLPLAAYNLLQVPFLWTGAWGSWALGWLDTSLPAFVPAAGTAAFVAVGFGGLGLLTWRKAVALGGTLIALTVIPVYVLTAGGDMVGENLQPRYLLPLVVLLGFLLVTEPDARRLRFTRVQTAVVLAALAASQFAALQVNIRRYVTGADHQGLNLDAGAEWWWDSLPLGPTTVWLLGAAAYAAMLLALAPQLRRVHEFAAVSTSG